MLKIKAAIYRYTGIYLANSEELEYINSIEFWKDYKRVITHPENDLGPRGAFGLLIGSWQAEHGFCRPFSFKENKIAAWLDTSFRAIKWDLEEKYGKRK